MNSKTQPTTQLTDWKEKKNKRKRRETGRLLWILVAVSHSVGRFYSKSPSSEPTHLVKTGGKFCKRDAQAAIAHLAACIPFMDLMLALPVHQLQPRPDNVLSMAANFLLLVINNKHGSEDCNHSCRHKHEIMRIASFPDRSRTCQLSAAAAAAVSAVLTGAG